MKLGFAPDQRDYADAIAILKHFKLKRIRLLTNNRLKLRALEKAGIKAEQVPLWAAVNAYNEKYIETKRGRMGHIKPSHEAAIKKPRTGVKGF